MSTIGCVRRVARATAISVANMQVMTAGITGMPIEVAKVNVALASAQER
jgi:hypothetical protein